MNGSIVFSAAIATAAVLLAVPANAHPLFPAPPADPESLLRQVCAAINAEDVEGIMALVADNATYTILPASLVTGQSSYAGKSQIRTVIEAVVAQHDRAELVGPVEVSDNRVRARARFQGDHLRRLGIDALEETVDWVVQDGQIQTGLTTYTPESVATLERAREAVLATSPEVVLRAYIAAANAGDVNAALALIADDVTYTVLPANPATGRSHYVGKVQFRPLLETLVSQNTHVEPIGSIVTNGEWVSMHARISQQNLLHLGIDALETDGEYIVQSGKLQSGTATFTPESVAKLASARSVASQTTQAQLPRTGAVVVPPTAILLAVGAVGVLAVVIGLGHRALRRH